jgi:diguanylate cyclase (GGDEF)-like protein
MMNRDGFNLKANTALIIGVAAGIAFWFVDSGVDAFFFEEESLKEQIFSPSPIEIWLRLFVLLMFIVFGIYAKDVIAKLMRTKAALAILEQQSDAASRFLSSIMDGITEPIMVISPNYHIKMMNRAARRFYLPEGPFEQTFANNLTCYRLFHELGSPCFENDGAKDCPVRSVLEKQEPVSMSVKHRAKDMEPHVFDMLASPMRGPDGAVTAVVVSARDVTEKKMAEEMLMEHKRMLEHMANHDQLTGLPNRTLFFDRLMVAIAHAHRNGGSVAVLFIDVDHFKGINDSMGHACGDQLLKEVSGRISGCLRECDTAARLGGDEFGAVLPDIRNAFEAEEVAQRLLKAVHSPCSIEGREVRVTLSIGVAVYPGDGVEASVLMKAADTALYTAKEQGRNRYSLFSPEKAPDPLEA